MSVTSISGIILKEAHTLLAVVLVAPPIVQSTLFTSVFFFLLPTVTGISISIQYCREPARGARRVDQLRRQQKCGYLPIDCISLTLHIIVVSI